DAAGRVAARLRRAALGLRALLRVPGPRAHALALLRRAPAGAGPAPAHGGGRSRRALRPPVLAQQPALAAPRQAAAAVVRDARPLRRRARRDPAPQRRFPHSGLRGAVSAPRALAQ